jgi:hypothetical protein
MNNTASIDDVAPVIVANNHTYVVVTTLLRYALTAGGTILLVNNNITDSAGLQNLVGAILAIVPGLLGAYFSNRSLAKQQKMADALPDSIAHRR